MATVSVKPRKKQAAKPRAKAPKWTFATQAELARALDTSTQAVIRWGNRGAPVKGRGPYDVLAVMRWFAEQYSTAYADRARNPIADDVKSSQARKNNADAMLKEIEIQQKHGNLCERDEVKRVYGEEVIRARDVLLRVPVKLKARMPKDHAEFIAEEVAREINSALTVMADNLAKAIEGDFSDDSAG